MTNKYYITTAIPYVNAAPHIGHALEFVQTDAIARYHRLLGEDVRFQSGADENAIKNVQAAEVSGIPAAEFVTKNSDAFESLGRALNCSFDDFIRTTDKKRHFPGVAKLWRSCEKDIYKKAYRGLYCTGCEGFLEESQLTDGLCLEHKRPPEVIEEENYFFRLSSYQEKLDQLISSDTLKVVPEFRKNEVLAFIRQGLKDFSVSRPKERTYGWGVPVPSDQDQYVYVWFDALANYITALGYGSADESLFQKFWPADLHVIGKGIIRFHAVYWPAMLLSAKLPLPKEIFVHGYITLEGQKISKSLGNVIDPFALIEKYGAESLRYYFLKAVPTFDDGDFSEDHFKEVYNSDLANGLGNLVSRIAKLCETAGFACPPKLEERRRVVLEVRCHIGPIGSRTPGLEILNPLNEYRFSEALSLIWQKISAADKLLNQEKPWLLLKEEKSAPKVKETLSKLVSEIREIIYLLSPFLPETSTKILAQFRGPGIISAAPLFPRI